MDPCSQTKSDLHNTRGRRICMKHAISALVDFVRRIAQRGGEEREGGILNSPRFRGDQQIDVGYPAKQMSRLLAILG